ncbi:AzlC family ABC transporter permease [Reinekea sp.]|jgi:4-azaleucine resistance transporter AzlC|uniref:AzlC family ABC transporter permease n=1 Tax=Reinekea sp. TaxID=1970455 RepID=UPI0039892807
MNKLSNRSAFLKGALDSLPMIVAAIPFGLLFGMLAPTNGIAAWVAIAISALVFAGSAQYVAIGLLAVGTPAILIVLTTFIVNLRHLLYAFAMLIPTKIWSKKQKVLASFFLTDETFVIFNQRYMAGLDEQQRFPYYMGSALFMYSNWQICTWIGLWAGSSLTGVESLGLEFAMVTAFIAMMTPMLKRKRNVASAFIAFALAWLFKDIPHKLGIILAVLFAALIASRIPETEGDEK